MVNGERTEDIYLAFMVMGLLLEFIGSPRHVFRDPDAQKTEAAFLICFCMKSLGLTLFSMGLFCIVRWRFNDARDLFPDSVNLNFLGFAFYTSVAGWVEVAILDMIFFLLDLKTKRPSKKLFDFIIKPNGMQTFILLLDLLALSVGSVVFPEMIADLLRADWVRSSFDLLLMNISRYTNETLHVNKIGGAIEFYDDLEWNWEAEDWHFDEADWWEW